MTEKKKAKRKGGASGPHKHPIMALRYPEGEIARWKAQAEREGLTLAGWVWAALLAYERGGKGRAAVAQALGNAPRGSA